MKLHQDKNAFRVLDNSGSVDDNGFPNVKAMLRGKMEVLTERR